MHQAALSLRLFIIRSLNEYIHVLDSLSQHVLEYHTFCVCPSMAICDLYIGLVGEQHSSTNYIPRPIATTALVLARDTSTCFAGNKLFLY